MENKKSKRIQERNLRIKRKMFEEIFQECQRTFSEKQFEFFTKCIIPQKAKINITQPICPEKDKYVKLEFEEETDITDIDPTLLTFERKEKSLVYNNYEGICTRETNRELLTTPKSVSSETINFSDLNDFQFFQKSKRKEEIKISQKNPKFKPNPTSKTPHNRSPPYLSLSSFSSPYSPCPPSETHSLFQRKIQALRKSSNNAKGNSIEKNSKGGNSMGKSMEKEGKFLGFTDTEKESISKTSYGGFGNRTVPYRSLHSRNPSLKCFENGRKSLRNSFVAPEDSLNLGESPLVLIKRSQKPTFSTFSTSTNITNFEEKANIEETHLETNKNMGISKVKKYTETNSNIYENRSTGKDSSILKIEKILGVKPSKTLQNFKKNVKFMEKTSKANEQKSWRSLWHKN